MMFKRLADIKLGCVSPVTGTATLAVTAWPEDVWIAVRVRHKHQYARSAEVLFYINYAGEWWKILPGTVSIDETSYGTQEEQLKAAAALIIDKLKLT